LVMGLLMLIGYYTAYFDSAISPWTTLGPLAVVVSLSIAQEGVADLARHTSDRRTNQFLCTVLSRKQDTEISGKPPKRPRRGKREPPSLELDIPIYNSGGEVIKETICVKYHSVQRQDIRVGQLVLVKNRDMIPCDLVLLASSGDNGGAYIETSGIDGETNLKLRNAAKALSPARSSIKTKISQDRPIIINELRHDNTPLVYANMSQNNPQEMEEKIEEDNDLTAPPPPPDDDGCIVIAEEVLQTPPNNSKKMLHVEDGFSTPPASTKKGTLASSLRRVPKYSSPEAVMRKQPIKIDPQPVAQLETLEEATTRIANWSVLGHPHGISCLELQIASVTECFIRPPPPSPGGESLRSKIVHLKEGGIETVRHVFSKRNLTEDPPPPPPEQAAESHVAMLTSEIPNASVHTFSGKLSMPSPEDPSVCIEIPLNAEHFLLRGAFLRNTEWAIGVAVFTGKDSKLVMNSSSAPSRLSQLDKLV